MSSIADKANKIKVVLTDVDGILTDGKLYYGPEGELHKGFHSRDGFAIKRLMNAGIQVGILTGRKSLAVEKRMQELGIEHVFTNLSDKLPVYEQLLTELGVSDQQVAYLGDDTPDVTVLQRVGLSITVSDAPSDIKNMVDWCLTTAGGEGAIREVADLLLRD